MNSCLILLLLDTIFNGFFCGGGGELKFFFKTRFIKKIMKI